MIKRFMLALVCCGSFSTSFAAEKITVASGAQGNWETAAAQLGLQQGIFLKHGLDVQLLWTQGGGETLQAVVSGSADIGIGLGLTAVMAAYVKGAPIRPIANASTGPDLYWYVAAASPIKSLRDAAGKSMAYSTAGSSTQIALLGLRKLYDVDVRPVATGSPQATYTQVMSGQIDIGWAGPPFGIEQLRKGLIRVVVKEEELPELRDQTVRIMAANLTSLQSKKGLIDDYRAAYAETLTWMYSDPAAMAAYSKFSGIAEDIATQVRSEYWPKRSLDLNTLGGVGAAMRDGVGMKFLTTPLQKEQLDEFFSFYAR